MTTIALDTNHSNDLATRDDITLMHHISQGDTDAFALIYSRYTPRLAGFLRRYLQEPEAVEEVINDVMLALWQQCHDYDPAKSLASWLCGIARYKALSALRRTPHSIPESVEGETHMPSPEADIVRSEQCDQVRQAVQELPPVLRAVVQLAYHHHYTYQEIATRLQCPVNTVKDRMRQARRRLKPILASYGLDMPFEPGHSHRAAA